LNRELKILKYTKGLNNYGLYPTLSLLKEYEEKELYEECAVILAAVEQKFKDSNLFPNNKFPTKIEQFSEEQYKKMFDSFGLEGDVALKNNSYYIAEIKKL
tara:strand:- start:123452 stop:123754 length:303 start_codon:yes stop_codon:yes gene_type:complete